MKNKIDQPDLSVIIVNYNSGRLLKGCLQSVYQKLERLTFEIIVVDNGSIDGSVEMINQDFPKIDLLRNKENLGFAKAVNQGLRASQGRYALLVNPDAVFLNTAFDRLVQYMDQHPKVGIAGPKVYDDESKQSVQLSCRGFPSLMNGLFSRYSPLTKLFPNNRFAKRFLMNDWTHDAIRNVDWVSGCCMLLRKDVWRELSLLDEEYPLFFEDVDICYRAHQTGWQVVYFPEVEIAHFVGSVRAQAPFRTIVERHTGLWRFYRKFYRKHWLAGAIFFLGIYLRMIFLLLLTFFKSLSSLFADLVLIQCSFGLSYVLRGLVEFPWFERAVSSYLHVAPWFTGLQIFLLYIFDLYGLRRSRYRDYLDILPRVVKAVSLGTVMLVFIAFFSRQFSLPRAIILLSLFFNIVLLTGWRWISLRFEQKKTPVQRVLIYGIGPLAELVRDGLLRRASLNLLPVGFITPPGKDTAVSSVEPIVGTLEDLRKITKEKKIDGVIFAPEERSDKELMQVLGQCEAVRIDTQIAPELFEVVTGKVHLEHFAVPFLDPVMLATRNWYLNAKQTFDILMAPLLLALFAPLMGVIALLIRLDSPGPILFRQWRIGKGGNGFTVYKFRTMRYEPDRSKEMVEEDLEKLTSVGRFLRLTRLDELPQLINVIKRNMSLVGPRAEWAVLARKMEREIPYFEQRYTVLPGMTGWAQIEYKYTTSVKEYRKKLQYDLYYIKNMSFSLDLVILVKTVWVVLTGRGAR